VARVEHVSIFRPIYAKFVQVKSGKARIIHGRTGYVSLVQVRPG
jgi:hypothetical protein